VRAARNPLLERSGGTWRSRSTRPGAPRSPDPDARPRSLAAHRAILDAIEAKDEERAAARMREHLAVVGDLGFLTG
jgi:DNA-binding GntR family transcriptional regulator